MALDPKDQQLMRDAFYNALRDWSKAGGSFGSGTGSGSGGTSSAARTATGTGTTLGTGALTAVTDTLGKSFKFLSDEVIQNGKAVGGSLVDLTGKLIHGGVRVTDVTNVLHREFTRAGDSSSLLGKGLGVATEVLGEMATYVQEGVDVFRDLSKSGANFNNDVIELRNNAANARLSLGDFQDVVKNNTKSFAGLGGTVGGGAKVFSEFSKSFFDSRASDNLRLLGYTSKDVNEMMATQLAGMTKRELAETGGQQAAMDRLERMGKEMDAVSKLTGQRRDELDKELRKNREDAQRRAAIESMILSGGKNAREAMDASSIAFQKAGPTFAKAASDMITAGRPLTDEARDAVGTMSGEVQAALAEGRKAVQEGRTEDAKAAADRAAALFAAQSATKTTYDLAAQGVETFKAKIEAVDYGKRLQEAAEEFKKAGMSETEAIIAANKKLGDQVKKDQDAEGAATKTTILLENRLADASAALNNSLIVPLNNKLAPALDTVATKLQNLQAPDPKNRQKGYINENERYATGARGSMEGGMDDVKQKINDVVKGAIGPRYGKDKAEIPEIKDEKTKSQNEQMLNALRSKKDVTAPADQQAFKELALALSAKDREVVTAKIEELAKKQGTTSEALIKDGDIKKLRDALKEDPATKTTMGNASKALEVLNKGDAHQRRYEPQGRTEGSGKDKNPLSGVIDALQDGLFTTSKPGEIKGKVEIVRGVGGEAVGSKATWGDWFKGPKNRLTYLAEQEEEATVPKSKMGEFLDDMLGSMPEGLMKGRGNPIGGMAGFDFSKLTDSSKVSVSGGGSSTVKIPADEMAEMMKPFKGSFDKFNADFDEFGTNFDDVIAKMSHDVLETIGDPTALSVQDKIDAAIAAKEAAYDKLQKLWNEGSDEELNANHETYAEELRVAKENLSRVVDESMGDLVSTFNSSSEDLESSLESIAEDIDTEFGDLAGAMKRVAEEMYPDTEFGDLESAMKKASQDIDTEFGDLAGAMKRVAEDLYPDTEFGNLEGAMKAAQERMFPDTEFGDLDGAMKYAANQTPTTENVFDPGQTFNAGDENVFDPTAGGTLPLTQKELPKIDLNSLNLPGFGTQIRSAAATIPQEVTKPKQASPGKKLNEYGEEYTPLPDKGSKTDSKSDSVDTKSTKSTLDDVVKKLESLNSSMNRMIEGQADIGRRQISATRSNNNNIYERS
jgi:hypothetical protein